MTRPRFLDSHVFRAERFSLGVDTETGGYFLSTPISGHVHAVEFEAYFSIRPEEYRAFFANPSSAADFTEACMGSHAGRRLD